MSSSSKSLHEALINLESLPAIPKVAQEILSLKLLTEEGERTLLRLVEQDPLLSAKVIGLSNAPLFGASKEILTVRDAAAVLGLKRVKMIALSFAMMSSMAQSPAGALDVQGLWQHSLAVAMAMHVMAQAMPKANRPQDDEIFLSGLLHDIGFLVLNHIAPKLSDKLHACMVAEAGRPIEEIETEVLGMTHGELGAELGRYWNLPDAIVAVIRYHHQPGAAPAAVAGLLLLMANMAEKLLPTFAMPGHKQPGVGEEEWQALGIPPGKVEAIVEEVMQTGRSAGAAYS